MKTLLPPLAAIILCTGLSVLGCHLNGMPPHDLKIAAAVAFGVSAIAALGATAWARSRHKLPSQKSSD